MTSSFSPLATRRRFLAGSGAACLLGGCSPLLGGKDPPHLYTLQPATSFAPDLPTVRAQLAVATPQAAQSLDIERIVLAHSPTSFDYFADAAWADRTPMMIQGLLVESFENSGRIQAVGRDSGDVRADSLLQTELRNFEARYDSPDQPPQIIIRIGVKLIKVPDRRMVGTMNAEGQGKADRNDITSIVTAFNDTLGPVLRQIVEWSLRRL
jgi:cholesterol transport system auxiliary component